MVLSEEFYEAEVRDGFYIPSSIKRELAASLNVLNEIDMICKKYGIKYYVDYGTLLGAVRHKGFIPWDDDIDISMLREDYLKFISLAEKELPINYRLLSIYNQEDYDLFLSRVVNTSSYNTSREFLNSNAGFPYAAGVDIFPVDYYYRDESLEKKQRELFECINNVIRMISDGDINKCGINELISHINARGNFSIKLEGNVKHELLLALDKVMSSCRREEADYAGPISFWLSKRTHQYKIEWLSDTILLPFESLEVPVPIGYSKMMIKDYGENYMLPVKKWDTHGYPYYSDMEKLCYEMTGKYYYNRVEKLTDKQINEINSNSEVLNIDDLKDKRIVFISYKAKYFEKEISIYQKLSERNQVHVIPIPYYYKNGDGTHGNLCYEGDIYPENIEIVKFNQYDFVNSHTDLIFFDCPYDDYDSAITTHPIFYSESLKTMCDKLIYISPFKVDTYNNDDIRALINQKFFIRMPGVINADYIIVPTENDKEHYINELTSICSSINEDSLKNRIIVWPFQIGESLGIKEENIPDMWWNFLMNNDGNGKKILLYHTSVSELYCDKDKYFSKMKSVFDTFEDNKNDICVIFHCYENAIRSLDAVDHELWQKYIDLVNYYIDREIGIFDTSVDCSDVVAISDAYYGDRDSIMYEFYKLQRPVMIQNVEV